MRTPLVSRMSANRFARLSFSRVMRLACSWYTTMYAKRKSMTTASTIAVRFAHRGTSSLFSMRSG